MQQSKYWSTKKFEMKDVMTRFNDPKIQTKCILHNM